MEAPIANDDDDDSNSETSVNAASKKGYKSNFSIDSLLEKKLGNNQPPIRKSSSVRATSISTTEKSIAANAVAKPPRPIFNLAQQQSFPILDHLRSTFAHPNFNSLPRWPFLHPPPPSFSFAAVAPIWAMAAQAAANMGAPMLAPFAGSTGGGLVGTGGLNNEVRRPAPMTKAPPVKKYKCDVCAKAFSRSNTLVTHKRIHSGEKPFACEHCGRAFRQPGNLTRHRLTHTTVKPYVCTQCGKAFNRASNLHTHMRTHTDYRPYVCPFCAKAFHQKIDMKIHSYTHTGEKPFRCTTCHKGFTLSSTLNAHRRSHCSNNNNRDEITKRSPTLYSCEHCGKDFLQRSSLKNHILASHPCRGGDSRNIL